MFERAKEIAEMLGYTSTNELLTAIGSGDVIVLKVPNTERLPASKWLRGQAPEIHRQDDALGSTLEAIAAGLDFAMELKHYPSGSDICDMDLPNGWPSYCDQTKR